MVSFQETIVETLPMYLPDDQVFSRETAFRTLRPPLHLSRRLFVFQLPFHPREELLGVRTDLGPSPGRDELLDLFPVLAVYFDCLDEVEVFFLGPPAIERLVHPRYKFEFKYYPFLEI